MIGLSGLRTTLSLETTVVCLLIQAHVEVNGLIR